MSSYSCPASPLLFIAQRMLFLAAVFCTNICLCLAQSDPAGASAPADPAGLDRIFSQNLQGHVLVRDLVFLGSHDTACVRGSFNDNLGFLAPSQWYETQSLSVGEQLRAGVRDMDLRFGYDHSAKAWRAYHGEGIARAYAVPLRQVIDDIMESFVQQKAMRNQVLFLTIRVEGQDASKKALGEVFGKMLLARLLPYVVMRKLSSSGNPLHDGGPQQQLGDLTLEQLFQSVELDMEKAADKLATADRQMEEPALRKASRLVNMKKTVLNNPRVRAFLAASKAFIWGGKKTPHDITDGVITGPRIVLLFTTEPGKTAVESKKLAEKERALLGPLSRWIWLANEQMVDRYAGKGQAALVMADQAEKWRHHLGQEQDRRRVGMDQTQSHVAPPDAGKLFQLSLTMTGIFKSGALTHNNVTYLTETAATREGQRSLRLNHHSWWGLSFLDSMFLEVDKTCYKQSTPSSKAAQHDRPRQETSISRAPSTVKIDFVGMEDYWGNPSHPSSLIIQILERNQRLIDAKMACLLR